VRTSQAMPPFGLSRLVVLWRELGAFAPLALFTAAGPAAGAVVLAATSGAWFPWLAGLGGAAAPVTVLLTVVLAGLSLVPTHAASLVAGLLFGASAGLGVGVSIALAGILGAAVVGFVVARRCVGARATAALLARPRARAVHDELLVRSGGRAVLLIALVRLSPVMPFAATNLLLAASGARLWTFLLGSGLGLLPRIAAVVAAGAGMSTLDLSAAADRRLLSAGVAATLLALVLAGRIARRALLRAVAATP